jgi:hypothetical protein
VEEEKKRRREEEKKRRRKEKVRHGIRQVSRKSFQSSLWFKK